MLPIIVLFLCMLALAIFMAGCDEPDDDSPPNIDYSYMLGLSPNYTMLYAPDYRDLIDMVAENRGNMIRVFAYAGWNDAYVYKPWLGGDITNIDQDYIDKLRMFVSYATSKGIITIFSIFHYNGDPFAYCMDEEGNRLRIMIHAIVNATKDKAVIYEGINEDINTSFANYVQNTIRQVKPDAKTCFYADEGGTYRIEHVLNKSYIGGGVIHSNDRSNYTQYYNAGDYYNIAKQAKEQGGHVEYLLGWAKDGRQLFHRQEIEAEYRDTLNLVKTLR